MLNFENKGIPICVINSKKEKDCIICLSDEKTKPKIGFEKFQLDIDEKISPYPSNRERDSLYISGQSGSGKSYYCYLYADYWKKLNKDKDIYVFSTITQDETLDKIKDLQRIDILDPEFIESDLPLEEFENSLVVFDDVENISNKKIKKKVYDIMNNILMTGRHLNISVLTTTHNITKGNETKTILAEAHSITLFPKTTGNRTLNYVLGEYFGLDKQQIQKIRKLPSRFITITRTYPSVIFWEKGISLLENF